LSDRGREQLIRLRERLQREPPVAALYSSPLRRAVETAQAAPDYLLARLRLIGALAEIHCGEVEGLPIEDIKRRFPEHWYQNETQSNDDFAWPGGETYRRFRHRVLRAVGAIARRHRGERVLIVTHAGVVNQILGTIMGQSAARWENLRPANTSITEVSWNGCTGALECFDDTRHLDGSL
jgi:broad specificity phosphatase PhoE